MKLIITVDTEADNQWNYNGRVSLENLKHLTRFQDLCDRYAFRPTYLIACEVLQDDRALLLLRQWRQEGRAEIGAHLEPWTTPPFLKEEEQDRAMQAFPSELPEPWFGRKLETLTSRIEGVLGEAPRSFRAARWGLCGSMVRALAACGYLADCSVTPKISWSGEQGLPGGVGGPDYRLAPLRPYPLSAEDVCRPGDSAVLEVPPTVIYTGPLGHENRALARRFSRLPESLLKRLLNRFVFRQRWLRISRSSGLGDWRCILLAAQRDGLDALQFMIHSSELMAGGSPLSRTEEDAGRVWVKFEEMLRFFREKHLAGCTLLEYRNERIAGSAGREAMERP